MDLLEQARQIINETDDEMRRLFVRRMDAVRMVAEYKKQHGLPILDQAREDAIARRNSERVEDPELREYYINFIRGNMELSSIPVNRVRAGMQQH